VADVEIEGQRYVVDKLDTRTQFHVVRRIAPLMAARAADGDMLANIAKAMGAMTDADANYVLDACLAKVRRREGDRMAAVIASGGHLMFDDIDMSAMLRLAYAVLQEAKLPDFFPTAPSTSGGEGQAPAS
jgi:hypothetical protein